MSERLNFTPSALSLFPRWESSTNLRDRAVEVSALSVFFQFLFRSLAGDSVRSHLLQDPYTHVPCDVHDGNWAPLSENHGHSLFVEVVEEHRIFPGAMPST